MRDAPGDCVSVLFNEPKLLKFQLGAALGCGLVGVSVLFNEPKLLKFGERYADLARRDARVSVLFNEPKLLKSNSASAWRRAWRVSVLFNEPKLLKSYTVSFNPDDFVSFSALQRAEIAEIKH